MTIAVHNCQNKYQDERYGKAHRVVNPTAKSKSQGVVNTYRCTVCGGLVDKSAVVKS